MKRTFWQIIFGYKYILNTRSNELHRISSITNACNINLMAEKNKKFLTARQANKKLRECININGCCHCFKEKNNDV